MITKVDVRRETIPLYEKGNPNPIKFAKAGQTVIIHASPDEDLSDIIAIARSRMSDSQDDQSQ